ncbi:MAG: hypothetical protein MUE72_09080 [Chitinophagaceae bacterium]|nr:hypothetical protein [Chitinophagaceae bacterium]MCU0383649.1 hypothetical protein [Cyclobacteriaceae bacterium]
MKKTAFIFFCSLWSCSLLVDDKLVRKEIRYYDINVIWYYKSYITSTSPDIVMIKRNGESVDIITATSSILDFKIEGEDSIKIKLKENPGAFIRKITPQKEVFGYKIIFDSTGKPEDFINVPIGQ